MNRPYKLFRSVIFNLNYTAKITKQGGEFVVIDFSRRFKKTNSRALVAYLPEPIIWQKQGVKFTMFSNDGLAITLPMVLAELGYAVDIIPWNKEVAMPTGSYGLAIFHGGYHQKLAERLKTKGTKIVYFSTGSYWKYHNQAEKDRMKYFYKRHHITLPVDRYIEQSEEKINSLADMIICLGNQAIADTYSKFSCVRPLNIATYPQSLIAPLKSKDWTKARRHWLFFSGSGNIHKGLDLLLDALEGTNIHLHIATKLDAEFAEFYADRLKEPNVHYEGFVNIGSEVYNRVMRECGFIVLPSCSEGSPGSVVDCMQQGLIPVLTHSSGIDTGDFGHTFQNDRVETLRKDIQDLAAEPAERLLQRACMSYFHARQEYSPAKFSRQLKNYLQEATT